MPEIQLPVEVGRITGSRSSGRLRAAGKIPGVIYGHGAEPLPISVDARQLFHVLHTEAGGNVLVDLQLDGEHVLAMPREVQRDHIRGRLLHVDFLRVARDEKISVEVPIQLVGESHGVKEGGVIEHHLWTLQGECLPQDVPTTIEADISGLGINESLKVADLQAPDALTTLTSPEETIVSVVPPQVLKTPEEEALEAAAEGEGEPTEAPPTEGSTE